ncbi:MAG: hypothetical protein ACFNKK_07325, partial [Peptidiphaga sp.]
MTATDPEAVADSAEAREPRDGGQNVREDPRPVWRRIDRADAARTLFTGLCAAVTAFAPAWPDRRWPAVAVVGDLGQTHAGYEEEPGTDLRVTDPHTRADDQ